MEVPIIGRLTISDYQALIIGLVFLFFESLLRFITFCLPRAGVQYFRNESQRFFSMIYKDERTRHVKILQHAESFRELVKYWDYPVEEHIVKTLDNYLLGVQRIPHGRVIPDKNKGSSYTKPARRARQDSMSSLYHEEDDEWPPTQNPENIESVFRRCGIPLSAILHPLEGEVIASSSNTKISSSSRSTKVSISDDDPKSSNAFSPTGLRESKSQKQEREKKHKSKDTHFSSIPEKEASCSESSARRNVKPVVLLYHGLMTCSEIWVCNYEYENRLACLLADAGYDVWFGNSRGNKYSMKHSKYDPSEKKFWEFSIDEFAIYDVPDTIEYILEITGAPSLTYIGFSQGSAQCLAALSINPKMNEKINLFIALAPATSPGGLTSKLCNALIKSSPNILYLFFGRKAMLTMVLFWKKVLSPPIFTKIVDFSLKFLFNWDCDNISEIQKIIGYYHLYSCSSVKCIVHWFQIIKSRAFQMYDELPRYSGLDYTCQRFPTQQITAPIAVFYGGRDSISDISTLLKQIPTPVLVREITNYEHLDFIWASDLGVNVYPDIFDLIIQHSHPNFREVAHRHDEGEILFDFDGSDDDHGYDGRRKNSDGHDVDMDDDDSDFNQRHLDDDSVRSELQPGEMQFTEIRHSDLQQSSAEVLDIDGDESETQRLTQGHQYNGDDESLTHSEPEVVTMIETGGDDDEHQRLLQRVIEGSDDDDFAMG